MCGLTGYYFTGNEVIKDTATIIEMLELQRHRGPDDSGIRAFSLQHKKSQEFTHKEATSIDQPFEGMLGFNRLSILDLSYNGHQPMCNADKTIFLTLNGEIYNAFDLKKNLVAEGVQFRSSTDTEVVLELYLKHGFEKMIQLLNGMFALVVVDLNIEKIYLSRDRFGIKPLYLFQQNDFFAFSSEIKSFIPLKKFKAELDPELLDEYLIFRNNVNKPLLRNVKNLDPGTFLVFSKNNGFTSHTYFNVENYIREENKASMMEESVEQLRQVLQASVKRQLISDVKLGCQLSGGIDSSIITELAKEIKSDGLMESISITLEDPRYSEENYIDHVTNKVELMAHKFQLDANYYLESFEKATWHFEGPINHPNTIGIYLLSEKAKKYVTVLLSGEGADEVFGGYSRFATVKYPFSPRIFLSGLKANRQTPIRFLANKMNQESRAVMSSSFMKEDRAGKLKRDFCMNKATKQRKGIYRKMTGPLFDRQIKYEIKTYLPDLLIRQDKMSMAHSIENRVPFLDNELVDFSFKLPEEHLLPLNSSVVQTKMVLKQLAMEKFGKPFAFRPKVGFGIPLKTFFSDNNFYNHLNDDILPSIKSRGIFDSKLIEKWIKNIKVISNTDLEALWIIIAFEVWMKKYKL